jgi:glycosyltransferase involved in cell wall biosynthesis
MEYRVSDVPVRYYRRWIGDHVQFSPSLLWRVYCECKSYDIVHIHSWWNTVSVFSAMICAIRGMRPIISLRGTLSDHSFKHGMTASKAIFHHTLGKRLLRRSVVHVTSAKEAGEAARVIPNGELEILPNIIYMPVAGHKQLRTDEPLRLISVGRLHPVKNLELLFRSLASLNGTMQYQLDIIGSGERAYVESLKRQVPPGAVVNWLGEIDGAEKFRRMHEADVLILLSHTENFGNVVMEALSQGTAVILSENVGAGSYVNTHGLGWVIPPSPEALEKRLKWVCGHREALAEIAQTAPDIVAHDFSPDSLTQRYVALYRRVMRPGTCDVHA